MIRTLAAALSTSVCIAALATPAMAQAVEFSIPGGSLKTALDTYARQSGKQVIYKADEVRAARSPGAQGRQSAEQALQALLSGSGFATRIDGSGAVAIVKGGGGPSARVDPAAETAADEAADEIVVTGTFIRGIAPAGTNVIGITAEKVQQTGAVSTQQLLQTIPQIGTFNSLQYAVAIGNTITVNRPNLRNLPGNFSAGGSTTLVLMDGHRMVGIGVASTTPDPDVIPPGAIERLEIVPDGGSAIYGSDAIAGVMNFITRKKFDGVQVGARYGIADEYYQYTLDATAGRDWGSGGLYVSYSFAKNDKIRGRDRDYMRSYPTSNGLLPLNCLPGNVRVGAEIYGLPGKVPVPNQCDPSDDAVMYPSMSRHSALAGFTQDLSDSLSVDVKAFYTHREQGTGQGPHRPTSGVTIESANPFFAARRIGSETSHSVTFAFGDANSTDQHVTLDTWGVTPTLTYKIDDNWQFKVLGNYGESTAESRQRAFNATALTNAINSFLFNPYDPASSDASALAIISNWEVYGRSRQEMANLRAMLDGTLFALPGGDVKLAVGGEYIHETFTAQTGPAVPGFESAGAAAQLVGAVTIAPAVPGRPVYDLAHNIKSVFGELVVPIFGAGNATPGLEELRLSLSGRYDHYSDAGGTFNPKIGLTWKPFDFVAFRGSWGKSFNAPSLADAQSADAVTLIVLPTTSFGPSPAQQISGGGTYPNVTTNNVTYIRRGNSPGITPQKAQTWSIGADVTPSSSMKLGVTYYHIFLEGVIGLPTSNAALAFRDFTNHLTINPSVQALDSVVNAATVFTGTPCHNSPTPCPVYAIYDFTKNNQGDFKLSGLDANVNVNHPTGFGSLGMNVNANYELDRKERASPSAVWLDKLIANAGRFRIRTTVEAVVGNLFAQATWNHSGGYKLDPAVGFVPQTSVSAYDVFNLFFSYDVKGEGLGKELRFTLGIDNVFDKDPPVYRLFDANQFNFAGFVNGNTLGRMVQFGISKTF